jgi:hypothetical protein
MTRSETGELFGSVSKAEWDFLCESEHPMARSFRRVIWTLFAAQENGKTLKWSALDDGMLQAIDAGAQLVQRRRAMAGGQR